MWSLAAAAAVVANIVLWWSLRRVTTEVASLDRAGARLGRLAVATDDTRVRIDRVVPAYHEIRPRFRAALRPAADAPSRRGPDTDR